MIDEDMFDRRATDLQAERVARLIEEEPDERERKRLSILQYLVNQAALSARVMTDFEKDLSQRIQSQAAELEVHREEIRDRMKEHERTIQEHQTLVIAGKTSIRNFAWATGLMVGILTVGLGATINFFANQSKVVDGLRESMIKVESSMIAQGKMLPEIKNELQAPKKLANSVDDLIESIDSQEAALDNLRKQVSIIQNKKVIRRSK